MRLAAEKRRLKRAADVAAARAREAVGMTQHWRAVSAAVRQWQGQAHWHQIQACMLDTAPGSAAHVIGATVVATAGMMGMQLQEDTAIQA